MFIISLNYDKKKKIEIKIMKYFLDKINRISCIGYN